MNYIVLDGGLGNRMRVAASALATAKRTGAAMRVVWTPQWGMRCRFDSLFAPLDAATLDAAGCSAASFELRDAAGWESLAFARATVRNLWLPRAVQRTLFRRRIAAEDIWRLNRDAFDYDAWFRRGKGLMTAYRDFSPWTVADLQALFRPNAEVLRLADERTAVFTPHTIGIHVRRTDLQQAIDESPLELFESAIDREAERHADLAIYLATDDEPTKAELTRRYGRRILTAANRATRDNADGIRDALVDMVALGRTSHIYGSAGSSFSTIAACLGNTPIDIVHRDGTAKVDLLCSDMPGTRLNP